MWKSLWLKSGFIWGWIWRNIFSRLTWNFCEGMLTKNWSTLSMFSGVFRTDFNPSSAGRRLHTHSLPILHQVCQALPHTSRFKSGGRDTGCCLVAAVWSCCLCCCCCCCVLSVLFSAVSVFTILRKLLVAATETLK